MVEVRVKGVAMPDTDSMPVVVLEEVGGSGAVAVCVGAYEAGAIIMELEGVSTPRPLTHVLMAQLFQEQGLRLRRVELYGVYGQGDDGYLARIEYAKGMHRWTRDVRPSDALALAATTGAPVYAHASLLGAAENSCSASDLLDRPGIAYWHARQDEGSRVPAAQAEGR